MNSLKEILGKIDNLTVPVSYKDFASHPTSLRQAFNSMEAPQNWQQIWPEVKLEHQAWTDEVQGVGWDGANWIFSCNANQTKIGEYDKSIFVFPGGKPLKDDNWTCRVAYKDVPHPLAGTHESDDHWGQLTCYNGFVYVSHFWEGGQNAFKNVVIFKNNDGFLQYYKPWIQLPIVTSSDNRNESPEFQAINPWDGKFYTCLGGDGPVHEFFIHDPDTGEWKDGKTLKLSGYKPCRVQGACFSPNGHLYVAVNQRFSNWGREYKWIFYYSAWTGVFLGKIPVLAEDTAENAQELEGLCYGDCYWPDGRRGQIHVVLLENSTVWKDNIFFKSFSADLPDSV